MCGQYYVTVNYSILWHNSKWMDFMDFFLMDFRWILFHSSIKLTMTAGQMCWSNLDIVERLVCEEFLSQHLH